MALVTVISVVSAALLLGAGLYALGAGESDVVEGVVDDARAFYLAEGGLAQAKAVMEELGEQDPPVYPADFAIGQSDLGGGTYEVAVAPLASPDPWMHCYEVLSTGGVDGMSATVRAVLRDETFGEYLFYANHSDDIWFVTGDSLDGRVHANGHIKITGTPWFGMKVTSSMDNMIVQEGSAPIFEDGYELGVEEVPLPSGADLATLLSSAAASGGISCGALNGSKGHYEVELARGDQYGYLSYRAYRQAGNGNNYSWSDWTSVRLSNTSGVAWFAAPIEIKGILDGTLTIGCSADITITDDVRYRDSVPGYGPNPGCDDLLGLCSAMNVIVADTVPNRSDCEIHAHIMALDKAFAVDKYNQGDPRGRLMVYGGVAQDDFGPIGTFKPNGDLASGYNKIYHYDEKLATMSPPGYPATGGYVVASWGRMTS